jgi:hypothetical protein
LVNQSLLLEIFEISIYLGHAGHVIELVRDKTGDELIDIRDRIRILNAHLDMLHSENPGYRISESFIRTFVEIMVSYDRIPMYYLIEAMSLFIEFKSIIDIYHTSYDYVPLLTAVVQKIYIDPEATSNSLRTFAAAERSLSRQPGLQFRILALKNSILDIQGEVQSRNDSQLVERLAQFLVPSDIRQVAQIRMQLRSRLEGEIILLSVLSAFEDWLKSGPHIAQISEFLRFTSTSSLWTVRSSTSSLAPFFAHHFGYRDFLAGINDVHSSGESTYVNHRIARDPRLSLDYRDISPEFGEFLNQVREDTLRDPYDSTAWYLRAVVSRRDTISLQSFIRRIQLNPFTNQIEQNMSTILQPEIVWEVMEKIPETFNIHPIVPLLESEDAVKFFVQSPRLYALSRRLVERFIAEIFLENASHVYRVSCFGLFGQIARIVRRGTARYENAISSALLDALQDFKHYTPGTPAFDAGVYYIESIL